MGTGLSLGLLLTGKGLLLGLLLTSMGFITDEYGVINWGYY